MTDPTDKMPDTKFTFIVGMALGRAFAKPPVATIPALQPGQRSFQVWSEPDYMGYRYLMTFELRESDSSGSHVGSEPTKNPVPHAR